MAESYIELPIETDPAELAQEGFDYLNSVVPGGWVAASSKPEAWLIEAVGRMAAELRDTAALVPLEIFKYLGQSIHGIAAIEDLPSVATVQFTVKDAAGYTIPDQTTVSMRLPDGTDLAFETSADLVIPAASTTGTVTVVAVEPGAQGNTATAPVELVDALEYVTAVALTVTPSGGATAETTDAYLSRLSTELQLQSPRPILARDFAILALRVTGVARAVGIDGWNPNTSTSGNERTVSVALIGADGLAVSAGVKASVVDLLEGLREVNFLVYAIDATYTSIKVNFAFTVHPNYDGAEVLARAEAAVVDYLSPAKWGLPPDGTGGATEWRNKTVVRYLEVAAALDRVEGLDEITLLQIAKLADAFGTADITMAGAAPLPRIINATTDVTGAVTA